MGGETSAPPLASVAPLPSSTLRADAPLFVPQSPTVPQSTAPLLISYVLPPADMLPPIALPCPALGPPPPPPPVIGSAFHGLLPPVAFPVPFQGPPPPPGFLNTFPARPPLPPRGFQRGHALGLPPPKPMPMRKPHEILAVPAAQAGVQDATPPEQAHLKAAVKNGHKAPSGSSRKHRPPRQHRAAKRAPVVDAVAVGEGAHGGEEGDAASVPSPRSVLLSARSPPGSPSFPLPSSATSSPPLGPVTPTRCQHASVPGARRAWRRPRRRFDPASSLTTLMIRNIPNGFTRKKVMNIIDQHCAEENAKIELGGDGGGVNSEYDFLYVPFDFRTTANKGYCFVNVTSPDAAFRLWKYLHGYRWKVNDSRKVCQVDYAAIQGREKLVAHFSKSWFECDTEEFLPVCFSPPRSGTRPAVIELHSLGRRM